MTLHRQSFILIEQTKAHIIIRLFLYRRKVGIRQSGKIKKIRTQTFSSSFSSFFSASAAGAPPPPEAGAAETAPPPDGTCTQD